MPPTPPPERDPSASLSDLITASYPALCRMAAARVATTKLSASSLAHETICRLLRLPRPPRSTDALQGIAYQLMEWGLLDRLRQLTRRRELEQGSSRKADGMVHPSPRSISISEHLARLASLDERKAHVVAMWALGNMTMKQIADGLAVCEKTVQRDLDFGLAWLAAAARREDA